MGNSTTLNAVTIGDININGLQATLPVHFVEPTRLSMIVQDKAGHPQFETNFLVEKGSQKLTFNFDTLEGGRYDAWIEADGKTYIRSFNLPIQKKKGVFAQLMSLFTKE